MGTTVERLEPPQLDAALPDLTEVLCATVADGAAVSFLQPLEPEVAAAFFKDKVFPAVQGGGCRLFVAKVGPRIAGTVQLWVDMPPNQPHRGEVAKLLVHPNARRQGLGQQLMAALEEDARALGKKLITLDTRTDSNAHPLYQALGYAETGEVPNFALNPEGDGYHPTMYMHKLL